MRITYEEKNVKREIKTFLKKNNARQVKFEMFLLKEYPRITITGYGVSDTEFSITKFVNTEGFYIHEYRIFDLIEVNDVVLDFILADSFHLSLYPKNLDNIGINGNNCYFMDTIIVRSSRNNTVVKHSAIGFDSHRMINKI